MENRTSANSISPPKKPPNNFLDQSLGYNYQPFLHLFKIILYFNLAVFVSLIVAIGASLPLKEVINKNLFYAEYLPGKYQIVNMGSLKEDNSYLLSYAVSYILKRETIFNSYIFAENIEWVQRHTYPDPQGKNFSNLLSSLKKINENFLPKGKPVISRSVDIVGARVVKANANSYDIEVDITTRDSFVFVEDLEKNTDMAWRTRTVKLTLLPYDGDIMLIRDNTVDGFNFTPPFLVTNYGIQDSKFQENAFTSLKGEYRDDSSEIFAKEDISWTTPRTFFIK